MYVPYYGYYPPFGLFVSKPHQSQILPLPVLLLNNRYYLNISKWIRMCRCCHVIRYHPSRVSSSEHHWLNVMFQVVVTHSVRTVTHSHTHNLTEWVTLSHSESVTDWPDSEWDSEWLLVYWLSEWLWMSHWGTLTLSDWVTVSECD